jgi:hypothetical protein
MPPDCMLDCMFDCTDWASAIGTNADATMTSNRIPAVQRVLRCIRKE